MAWKPRESTIRWNASGRVSRTPTTTSAPAPCARKRWTSSILVWPSAGARKIQSPRDSRKQVVIAPVKPRFAAWCTTRTFA